MKTGIPAFLSSGGAKPDTPVIVTGYSPSPGAGYNDMVYIVNCATCKMSSVNVDAVSVAELDEILEGEFRHSFKKFGHLYSL
jgi:hypothetical protein